MDNENREVNNSEAASFPAALSSVGLEADLRSRSFELVGPTYILDSCNRIADWNPAFEELIATPLRLVRQQICPQSWHHDLSFSPSDDQPDENSDYVMPQVVQDWMELELPGYGTVSFRRIVSQLVDDLGAVVARSAHLIVMDPDQAAQLWARIQQRLEQQTTWSKYAAVYDALLLNFTDYGILLENVARQVAGARVCIDLGAGTGNSAIALLNNDSARSVCAVDSNDFMLRRLRRKMKSVDKDRLIVHQCDICSMPCFPDGTFDGATMVNTLYALEDPEMCLREVCRIMKPDGILVLTTSHNCTDVDRLFARLQEDLTSKGVFGAQQEAFHAARERHAAMDSMIHRFTIEELRSMIESCGFEIESSSSEYVDAVVLIKARKR